MPTVSSLSTQINSICQEIKQIKGVTSVYLYGSFANNIDKPNFVVKDVDVIASTNFDSGDLLAIDKGQHSALRLAQTDLEDFGFNPEVVNFTKRFLTYEKYNIDHWATSGDNKLMHWGAIPDNQEDWEELHKKAEKYAERSTGLKRSELKNEIENKKANWKSAYDHVVKTEVKNGLSGWYLSDHLASEILLKAKKI